MTQILLSPVAVVIILDCRGEGTSQHVAAGYMASHDQIIKYQHKGSCTECKRIAELECLFMYVTLSGMANLNGGLRR